MFRQASANIGSNFFKHRVTQFVVLLVFLLLWDLHISKLAIIIQSILASFVASTYFDFFLASFNRQSSRIYRPSVYTNMPYLLILGILSDLLLKLLPN